MKLRIGLATGPVSVGMIGMKIPKYCVFGETVNLATAMEERSQGELFEFDLQRILNSDEKGGERPYIFCRGRFSNLIGAISIIIDQSLSLVKFSTSPHLY